MRRTGWWILLAAVVVAPFLLAEFTVVEFWDGGYYLTVHVTGTADSPSAVACCPMGRREAGEWVCGRSPTTASFDQPGDAAVANPFTGQPLKVHVWLSGRRSPILGRELERSRQQFLVVVSEWPDDRKACKVVDIPDGRVTREMRVSLP